MLYMAEKKRRNFFLKSFIKKYIREKCVLLIYLMISLSFFVQIPKETYAQSSQQQACCEKTKTGESCVYTDRNNCDNSNNLKTNYDRCEAVAYCTNVCCVSGNSCSPNTPKSICENLQGSQVFSDASCNSVSGCKTGCCILGGNYNFNSELECKNLADKVYGRSNYDFNEVFKSANNELECLDLSLKDEEGCCVDNNLCNYGKKSDCGGEFNFRKSCSQVGDCINLCKDRDHKGCKDGDLYWFDSCGSTGELIEQCNYDESKLCVEDNKNAFCKDINCPTTKKYDGLDYTGGPREHGESWCVYEGQTGNFRDKPGSIHYRFKCENGEEISESGRDFREEICLQAVDKDGFSRANPVRNNIYNSPVNSNISTVAKGFEFWEDNEENKEQCNKGTTRCTVVYVKENELSDWDCEGNCECESQEFIDQANTYCRSFGDCGFSYNIAEEKGSAGLSIFWTGSSLGDRPTELSQSYLDDLNKKGIFGGMEFLNSETEKIISFSEDASKVFEASETASEALFYSTVTLTVFNGLPILAGSYILLTSVATIGASAALEGSLIAAAGVFAAVPVAGWILAAIALIAAAVSSIILGGGSVREKTINIECKPWKAPLGGANCEKCTDDPFKECTEYRCRGLGAGCELINEGTTSVKCVDGNPNDLKAPKLEPIDFGKQKLTVKKVRLGYKIVEDIEPYKQFTVGVITDEFALCRYDLKVGIKYEDMGHDLSDSSFKKEHNLSLSLVGNKEFKYYVRCTDNKDNTNDADYEIRFKTKPGQDRTAPKILSTTLKNNANIANNIDKVLLGVEITEPGYCRFDVRDNSYDKMTNQGICTDEPSSIPMHYNCNLAIDKLKIGNNNFYIRCSDIKGNNNTQSSPFTLVRSNPLVINKIEPKKNDLIYVNDITLNVNTIGGSENGKSICRYSLEDLAYEQMTEFKVTDSNNHLQSQTDLRRGTYNYYVKCRDSSGNEAKENTNFKIILDKKGNEIVYTYKDSSTLYVVLNVAANCEYKDKDFVFGTGNKMGEDTTVHTAPLEFNQYYVKCRDDQGNEIKGVKINV